MIARHIAFPEAGADAYLHLSEEGMEELSYSFGTLWLDLVDLGLVSASPVVITRCLAAMLYGEDEDGMNDAPWNMPLDEIASRLRDAFYLRIKGKTPAEIAEDEAAILKWTIDNQPEACVELVEKVLEKEIEEREKAIADRIARRKAEAALKAAKIGVPA